MRSTSAAEIGQLYGVSFTKSDSGTSPSPVYRDGLLIVTAPMAHSQCTVTVPGRADALGGSAHAAWRTMQRKPMWQVEVSIPWAMRAAGR